jgi:thiamine biosynthesis protein ThiS
MTIQLNGDPFELAGPLTIAELLASLGVDSRRVAVELNLTVLKRPAFETTVVHDGDQVEIVNFVGGGCQSHPTGQASWRRRRPALDPPLE